jgi:hypothetical protein
MCTVLLPPGVNSTAVDDDDDDDNHWYEHVPKSA